MMIERVPIIDNPQLFDRVIADIQQGLADNLLWLDYSFGRAERLVKVINGKKYFTPNIYIYGNDYIPVSPDSNLGNFSFFLLDEPQSVDWDSEIWESPFSIIFWFDLRRVTNDENNRNTEAIKATILNILNGGFHLKNGSIIINRVYEKAENIYKGFTLDEVDNQFLMHPYSGIKFEGKIRIQQPCL